MGKVSSLRPHRLIGVSFESGLLRFCFWSADLSLPSSFAINAAGKQRLEYLLDGVKNSPSSTQSLPLP